MSFNTDITSAFGLMVLGVNESTSLQPQEKEYIVALLQDQLRLEIECADASSTSFSLSELYA